MTKTPTFQLTDHLCRKCGTGRVLRQTNSGITGGGNPIWQCATCGQGGASLGPDIICWCNQTLFRGGFVPYDTMCGTTCPERWHVKSSHYGLLILWRQQKRVEGALQINPPSEGDIDLWKKPITDK